MFVANDSSLLWVSFSVVIDYKKITQHVEYIAQYLVMNIVLFYWARIMLKIRSFILFLIVMLLSLGQSVWAKSVCTKDPTYNMTAFTNFVEISEGRKRFILHQTGDVSFNGQKLVLTKEEQQKVKALVDFIIKQLSLREQEAKALMQSLHEQFVTVVNTQLEGNRQLITMLDNTYNDAMRTLGKAIKSNGNVTEFIASDFHKIIDRASGDFKLEMAKIVSKSIFTFNVGRNYTDIKYLGDQEWKKRKAEAKAFHKGLCADLQWITTEKSLLLDRY